MAGGTLIRHAAADAVGALAVAVVEATFQAPLMPSPGGPHRAAPAEHPARRRAVRTLTEITLLCAERQKPQKTGSAWMHLATLYRSLS